MADSVSSFESVHFHTKGLSSLFFSLVVMSCAAPGFNQAGHTLKTASAEIESEPSPVPRNGQDPESRQDETGTSEIESPPEKTPPPEPLLSAEVPATGKLIGESRAVAVEGLGAGGHWVAYCQSPIPGEGGRASEARGALKERPDLFLSFNDQSELISALLSADEEGRFVVVLKKDVPFLIDAVSGVRTDLSPLEPDLRFDGDFAHRSFVFAGGGLVFLSKKADVGGYYLPLGGTLTPSLKDAIPLSFGERDVWRLEGGTRSVAAHTVAKGAPWPVPLAAEPVLRCQSPTHPYPAYARLGAHHPDPKVETSWLALPSGRFPTQLSASEAPGYVMSFADGWVRRLASGQLLLVRSGTQKQIASESCGARILRADETSGLFLVACEEYQPTPGRKVDAKKTKPKYRFDLYLLKPGFVKPLGADVARTGVDVHGPQGQILTALRPGTQAALVDFRARTLIPLPEGVDVLATDDESALLRRGSAFSLWTKTGEKKMVFRAEPLTPLIGTGPAVALGDTIITLKGSTKTFKLSGEPLVISAQGYALIPRQAGSLSTWPLGPLLLMGPPPEH